MRLGKTSYITWRQCFKVCILLYYHFVLYFGEHSYKIICGWSWERLDSFLATDLLDN